MNAFCVCVRCVLGCDFSDRGKNDQAFILHSLVISFLVLAGEGGAMRACLKLCCFDQSFSFLANVFLHSVSQEFQVYCCRVCHPLCYWRCSSSSFPLHGLLPVRIAFQASFSKSLVWKDLMLRMVGKQVINLSI